MKTFKDYLAESEHMSENPVPGDDFAINIKEDCLIESYIIDVDEESVLIAGDNKMMNILESYGYSCEDVCNECGYSMEECACESAEEEMDEAEYHGKHVSLNKPTRGDVKKFKVYVKDPSTGNIKKVNFGHGGTSAKRAGQKTMRIKKSNPARRKSFRARHHCENPGPKTKARYWSCRAW